MRHLATSRCARLASSPRARPALGPPASRAVPAVPALVVLAVVVAVGVASPRPARADEPAVPEPSAEQAEMQREMTRYFRGERIGGVGFSSVGAASLLAGGLLYADGGEFTRGMSYPMLALGGVQLIVGVTVMFTPGPRIRRFTGQIVTDPQTFLDKERPRMRLVGFTFKALMITEVVLGVGGVVTAIVAGRQDRDTLSGFGAGVAVQAAVLFVQDGLASRRATRYARAMSRFRASLATGDDGAPAGALLSWGTAF